MPSLLTKLGRDDPLSEPEREFLAIAGELDLDGLVVVSQGIDRIIQTFGTDVQAQDRARRLEAAAMGLHGQQDPLVLGCFQLALRHRLHLEGEQGDRTLLCAHSLAMCLHNVGDYEVARDLLAEVLDHQRARHGFDHEDTLETANDLAVLLLDTDLAEAALELLQEAIEASTARNGAEDDQTLILTSNLADAYRTLGAFATSRQHEETVLGIRRAKYGDENPETLVSMNNLASTCLEQGRLTEARALQERVLLLRRKVLPPDAVDTITAMANLAVTLYRQGEWLEALRMERQVLEDRVRVQGEDHPDTWTAQNNLAGTLRDLGDTAEARLLLVDLLKRRQGALGAEHHETLMAQVNLSDILCKAGALEEADQLASSALAVREAKLGPTHPSTLTARASLAAIRFAAGATGEARALQESVVEARLRELGEEHFDTLLARNDLATMMQRMGEPGPALALYGTVLAQTAQVLGEQHADTLAVRLNVAEAQHATDDAGSAQAQALLIGNVLARRRILFADDYQLAARTFALLRELGVVTPLRDLFAKVSALMCASLELRTRDSAGPLHVHFEAFHERWQSFCVEHAVEDLPLALVATQGLEAAAELDGALAPPSRDSGAPGLDDAVRGEIVAARAALSDVRFGLEQIDSQLSRAKRPMETSERHSAMEELLRRELIAERDQLLVLEREAVRALDAVTTVAAEERPELTPLSHVPRRSASQISAQLSAQDLIVLLWRCESRWLATLLSSDSVDTLDLEGVAAVLDATADYAAAITLPARTWRQLYEDSPADVEAPQPQRTPVSIEILSESCLQAVWKPILDRHPEACRLQFVVDSNLHALPLEAGNPGVDARYFTGLPAFYRLRGVAERGRQEAAGSVAVLADAAWDGGNAIPFVEAEAELVEGAAGSAARLDVRALRGLEFGGSVDRLHIACHGLLRGAAPRRYPVLLVDSARGDVLDPLQMRQLAGQLREFYCGACVGGVVSRSPTGDPLGFVSALQLRGVSTIVASTAPLPDFYMPILAVLFWRARRCDVPAPRALREAKEQLCSGDWPEDLVEPIRRVYGAYMSKVLRRVVEGPQQRNAARASAAALASTLAGWWLPRDPTQVTPIAGKGSVSALISECASPEQLRQTAQRLADHLVESRHLLPRAVTAHICAFMTCYG
jgi:tetratricopeptide (TPR) repeat protein